MNSYDKLGLMVRVFNDACDEAGCAYDNEALLEAIVNLKAAIPQWQPIDTAPKGEEVLLYFPAKVVGAYKQSRMPVMIKVGRADDFPHRMPTLWMALQLPKVAA